MSTPTHTAQTSDLGRLVETERRLAERLAEARDAARRVVEEARQAARAAERDLEAELGESLAALRLRVEGERDRQIAEIAETARREAERLDGLPPERIAALAGGVLGRLLTGVGRP